MNLKKTIAAVALAAALVLAADIAYADGGAPAPGAVEGRSLMELVSSGPTGAKPFRSAGAPALSDNTELMGPACLEAGAELNLAGHTLTVYGDLTIGGTLTIGGGRLVVDGDLAVEGGLLVMTNAADRVEVSGAFIDAAADETGKLTAGRVRASGDFVQFEDNSVYSYNETGTHVTELAGAGKRVQFRTPVTSAVRNLVIISGTTFASGAKTLQYQYTYRKTDGTIAVEDRSRTVGGTYLAFAGTLASNYTITVPNLYFTGDQKGFTLTVRGSLIVPEGAELRASGNIAAASVDVEGMLTQAAGTISVTGSYRRRMAPGAAPFTVAPSGCALAVTKDTATEFSASAASVAISGNLGGRRASIAGSATVPPGASLDLGGGRLDVTGAMTVTGTLNMTARADTVTVGGKFTANGAPGTMTDGYLALRGDFAQAGGASFRPAGSHRTLLCGSGAQLIAFADPGSSSFANLFVLNGAVSPAAADALPVSGVTVLTGTALSGIAVDGGVALPVYPAFTAEATACEAVVPEGMNAVSITPQTAYGDADATVLVNGAEALGSVPVSPDGDTAVSVCVLSGAGEPYAGAGAPFSRVYTLKLQHPLLQGFALSDGITVNEPIAWDRLAYTADIPAGLASVTVTPEPGAGAATCMINGAATNSVELRLGFGGSATAEITLSDATGKVTRTYELTVRRAALLSGISVLSTASTHTVNAALKPAFTSAVHAYTADVPLNAGTVTVAGVKVLPGCLGVTVGGQADEGTLDVVPGGSADITVVASAGDADDQKAAYAVTVRKPFVTGLKASAGSFTKPFSADPSVAAAITLPAAQSAVVLTPVGNDGGAGAVTFAYSEGGKAIASGARLSLALAPGQRRTVSIAAAYQGAVKIYTLTVARELSNNANLSSLGVSGGWLSPAFSAAASYTLLLPEKQASVRIAPALSDRSAKYRIDSLAPGTPKTVSLALNKSATVRVVVTAPRGNTKTYTVIVRRGAMLSSVEASPVLKGYPSLSPGGAKRLTFAYRLAMPAAVKLQVRKNSRWYTILQRTEASAGAKTFAWDGKVGGKYLGAGTYTVRMTPYWHGAAGTAKTIRIRILPRS